ncbi:MAG: tetratricopeptide repeat protein [Candidatus Binatia bacterium]
MEAINAKGKILRFAICNLLPAILLSGCVAFQVGGEIEAGRRALRYGDPNVALAHFQRAAELDPDYLLNSSLDQGVWTYVGRSYYNLGKLPEARQALERARSRYERDHLAKLYLGLVLVQNGDPPRGLREIEAGLRGLEGWFDNLFRTDPEESSFWDPGGQLEKEIKGILAMIGGDDISWAELVARGEWLGQEFEEEIDLVRRDQFDEEVRDGDDDPRDE